MYSYDYECDDGGSGSEYSLCSWGTDCYDCGTRTITNEVYDASQDPEPVVYCDDSCSDRQPCKGTDDALCDEDCFPRYSVGGMCDPTQVRFYTQEYFQDGSITQSGNVNQRDPDVNASDPHSGADPEYYRSSMTWAVTDMTKPEDPDFASRCIDTMEKGDGFCQMMFLTKNSYDTEKYMNVKSVKVPAGCWLRLYYQSGCDNEEGCSSDKSDLSVQAIHGSDRRFTDVLTDTPTFTVANVVNGNTQKCLSQDPSGFSCGPSTNAAPVAGQPCRPIKGFKLTSYDAASIGRVLAYSKGTTGDYDQRDVSSFLPVGSYSMRAFAEYGMVGMGPSGNLQTCGSKLQTSFGALKIFEGATVNIFSTSAYAGNTRRLLQGTYTFSETPAGKANPVEFQNENTYLTGTSGPLSIKITGIAGRRSDQQFAVSASWTMMASIHKDNTGPEWPELTYGFETSEEQSTESGTESTTDIGSEASFATSVEQGCSETVTNSGTVGGSVSGGDPFGIVEVEASFEYTHEQTSETSSSASAEWGGASSSSQSEAASSSVAASAGVSKDKGMTCQLQCQVPSTLHPPQGNYDKGLAPGNEVNDGIGYTCPEATKMADPNVYIWYWQVGLTRPDDPTAKTKVDMCLTQCTCTPTPPACPIGECADEFCTSCKPPQGCSAMRVSEDSHYAELVTDCLASYGASAYSNIDADKKTGSIPVRQYRKDGNLWVEIWEGTIDVDASGPWSDNPMAGASGTTMEGGALGGAVAKVGDETTFKVGDYFSFFADPVEATKLLKDKKSARHMARAMSKEDKRRRIQSVMQQHMPAGKPDHHALSHPHKAHAKGKKSVKELERELAEVKEALADATKHS
jgi:hypothetical protein